MKSLSAGSEIDAWCTKCRLDLGHRIVAMLAAKPKRVVCLTCSSEHNFKAAGADKAKPAAKRKTAKKTATATTRPKTPKAEQERLTEWQERIDKASGAFTRYSIAQELDLGQYVVHKKFGEGYVAELLDDNKASVMFQEGLKTLIHSR